MGNYQHQTRTEVHGKLISKCKSRCPPKCVKMCTINTIKGQRLFFLFLFLTACPMLTFLHKQESAWACCPEQDKANTAESVLFWKYTERWVFPLNFQPCLYSKKNPLTAVSEFQELQKKCVSNDFCHFVCNSSHLENGSEIPVALYSARESFPTKFLCMENKREWKEYALNATAVFKNGISSTQLNCRTFSVIAGVTKICSAFPMTLKE